MVQRIHVFHLFQYCCAIQHKDHRSLKVNLATERYKVNSNLISKLEQICYLLQRGEGGMKWRVRVEGCLRELQTAQFFTAHNPVSPTSAHFDPPRYNPKNQILLLLSPSPFYSEGNRFWEIKRLSIRERHPLCQPDPSKPRGAGYFSKPSLVI